MKGRLKRSTKDDATNIGSIERERREDMIGKVKIG